MTKHQTFAPVDMYGVENFRLLIDQMTTVRAQSILGVSTTQFNRWLRGTQPVPRMAVLALFWESQYGRSIIDTDNYNRMQNMRGQINAVESENRRLHKILHVHLTTGPYAGSNDPFYRYNPEAA